MKAGGILPWSPCRLAPLGCSLTQDHSRSALEPGLERTCAQLIRYKRPCPSPLRLGCTLLGSEGPDGLVSCPLHADHKTCAPRALRVNAGCCCHAHDRRHLPPLRIILQPIVEGIQVPNFILPLLLTNLASGIFAQCKIQLFN